METVTVLITGAAGRISYSFIPIVLSGAIFGSRRVILKLFDIPEAKHRLEGVKMEIEDSNYAALEELIVTTEVEVAFSGVEVAVLIGGHPRTPGMERKDLLVINAESMKMQADALNRYATKETKVLVVANPANTNCLVAIRTATNIPPENFTCLTRLDQERLRGFCATRASEVLGTRLHSRDIKNVYILGNHSTTQAAYIEDGYTLGRDGVRTMLAPMFSEEGAHRALMSQVQHRGAAIIHALHLSSAMSAAEAIAKHLSDWLGPNIPTEPFSMGVLSNGNPYGVPNNLVFSFPCVRTSMSGDVKILPELHISADTQEHINATTEELVAERHDVAAFLHGHHAHHDHDHK